MTGTAWNSTLRPGGPLKRTKGLAPGTGLARGDKPLATGTGLARTTGIRPVSAQQAAENRRRRKMIAARFPDRPLCAVPWCVRWADDIHEILTRARGGSITDEANTVPVCRPCHDEITNEAPWAYEIGLLEHSWGPERAA